MHSLYTVLKTNFLGTSLYLFDLELICLIKVKAYFSLMDNNKIIDASDKIIFEKEYIIYV